MGVVSGQNFPGRFAPGCLLQHPPSLNPGYATDDSYIRIVFLQVVEKVLHECVYPQFRVLKVIRNDYHALLCVLVNPDMGSEERGLSM